MRNSKKRKTPSNIKWGICKNTDGYNKDGEHKSCSKCQKKIKQAIGTTKEFVCEECGSPLQPCPPPRPKTRWPWFLLVVVLLAGGATIYILKSHQDHMPQIMPPKTKSQTDTETKSQTDTETKSQTDTETKHQPDPISQTESTTNTKSTNETKYRSISFGQYDGISTITVSKQHTFLLKDFEGSYITVNPGDQLRNCIIKNGVLRSFQLVRPNNERQTVLDVNEKIM